MNEETYFQTKVDIFAPSESYEQVLPEQAQKDYK
jgi:hypothetical protein